MHACMRACVRACMQASTHARRQAGMHACIHSYTHTSVYMQVLSAKIPQWHDGSTAEAADTGLQGSAVQIIVPALHENPQNCHSWNLQLPSIGICGSFFSGTCNLMEGSWKVLAFSIFFGQFAAFITLPFIMHDFFLGSCLSGLLDIILPLWPKSIYFCPRITQQPRNHNANSLSKKLESIQLESVPGPQEHTKPWPKASNKSPKGHDFPYCGVRVEPG